MFSESKVSGRWERFRRSSILRGLAFGDAQELDGAGRLFDEERQ